MQNMQSQNANINYLAIITFNLLQSGRNKLKVSDIYIETKTPRAMKCGEILYKDLQELSEGIH